MINEKWIVKDGSVLTEQTRKVKTEYNTFIQVHKYIAFNVGEKVAEHIVKLHNESLGM